MQRPIINDFWVGFVRFDDHSVYGEGRCGESDGDGVVVPGGGGADLRNLPSPLGRTKRVQIPFGMFPPYQEDETTIAHKESKVMSVHFMIIRRANDVFLGMPILVPTLSPHPR
jgi:hypothetical protein